MGDGLPVAVVVLVLLLVVGAAVLDGLVPFFVPVTNSIYETHETRWPGAGWGQYNNNNEKEMNNLLYQFSPHFWTIAQQRQQHLYCDMSRHGSGSGVFTNGHPAMWLLTLVLSFLAFSSLSISTFWALAEEKRQDCVQLWSHRQTHIHTCTYTHLPRAS